MSKATALVTGATSGIGRATATLLAAAGWDVWVTGPDAAQVEATATQLSCRPLPMDVTDRAGVAAAAKAVSNLDVLVNNAGISPDPEVPLTDAGAELFRRTYEVNVFGVVTVTNAFLPVLRRSPHPRIVNLSSGTSSLAWSTAPNPQFDHHQAAANNGRLAAYRSSKTALNALTLLYAQALADDGIKVNALAPGIRATNLNPTAAARGGDPAEAAAAIVRLAELPDDGPTGQVFSYDGTTVPW
ncbi:SDR family NAD(P)-dependent oxidoreductase [Acidimicrobiaceae bacterium USS-CC1]|uniref:SDR family NAD(P)-dependent oxidoreductase n=1 Tax=Acidiferrimicrobium australe TaxID=2664430 RepID=A0ABW9QRN6_9ACTN|nr:SDR family NAD(P)-dependent oxidoreductase [Acidiferrimicrobium australe]